MKRYCLIILFFISTAANSQNLTVEVDALMKAEYKPDQPGAVALIAKVKR